MNSPYRAAVRCLVVVVASLAISGGIVLAGAKLLPAAFAEVGLDVWTVPQLLLDQARKTQDSARIDEAIRALTAQAATKESVIEDVLAGKLGFEQGLNRFADLVAEDEELQDRLRVAMPGLELPQQVRSHFELYLRQALKDRQEKPTGPLL